MCLEEEETKLKFTVGQQELADETKLVPHYRMVFSPSTFSPASPSGLVSPAGTAAGFRVPGPGVRPSSHRAGLCFC